MLKIIFIVFAALFLFYLILPGPNTISNFPPLPGSVKSTLEGDTIQVPNVAGYFSNNYREMATNFYRQAYGRNTWFPYLPLRLNHPPEFAFTAIKDQTHSTYLEEYFYPLRDSLYVNGEEPFLENGRIRYMGAAYFEQDDELFETKVTLRFYPSTLTSRLITWFGICLSLVALWKMSRRVLRNE